MVRNRGLWQGPRFVKSCPAVFSFPLLSCQVLPRSAMGSDNWICPASDHAMLDSGCIQRVFERQDASLQGFVMHYGREAQEQSWQRADAQQDWEEGCPRHPRAGHCCPPPATCGDVHKLAAAASVDQSESLIVCVWSLRKFKSKLFSGMSGPGNMDPWRSIWSSASRSRQLGSVISSEFAPFMILPGGPARVFAVGGRHVPTGGHGARNSAPDVEA